MEALIQFLPLIILGVAMYALVVLPQQRRAKAHRDLMASLSEGDEVLTGAGFYGLIAQLDDDIVWLEVADGVEMKVARSSISGRIAPEGEDD
jgi:preprotein translocase subunit YajC